MTEQEKQPRYFYVGQTVYHYRFGKGVVVTLNNEGKYPIKVLFEKTGQYTFTTDGRFDVTDPIVSLSQNPIPEIINQPLPEMPDLKEGDVVLYWLNDKKDDGGIGIFVKYVYGDENPFKISDYPNQPGFIGFKYCEKYDPEKHYKNETPL